MTRIHPSAVVAPGARLGEDVEVGAFSYVGPDAVVGDGTKIATHVIVDGHVTLGRDNQVLHHTVLGSPPQDFAYKGERSYLRIGDRNIIHEYITASPGTKPESETVIGSDCMIMIGVHVAHNCRIADRVVIVNYTALGGYVEVGERAFLSAFVAVHQHVKVGRLAMIASLSKIAQDFPPYMIGQDIPVTVYGLNTVGLVRAGYSIETRNLIKKAYKLLYHDRYNFSDALKAVEADPGLSASAEVMELVRFAKNSSRGLCRHHA